jgi:hypothetical protein
MKENRSSNQNELPSTSKSFNPFKDLSDIHEDHDSDITLDEKDI